MSESQFGSRTLLRILDKKDAEIERLRGLLKDVVGDVVQAADWERLMEEIIKEVGDE